MSNTQQVEDAFRTIEIVNHSVIAHTQTKSLDPFHPMMGVRVEGYAQMVNGGFDP